MCHLQERWYGLLKGAVAMYRKWLPLLKGAHWKLYKGEEGT